MSGFQFTLTPAGIAEMIAADHTGTDRVQISHIGVSASPDGLVGGKLVGEIKRLTTFAGKVVAANTIHVTIRDDDTDVYDLRAFALYSSAGTLLGWHAQADVILEKAAQAMLMLAADIQFNQVNANVLQFNETNWTNPPGTTAVAGVLRLSTDAETIKGTESTTAVPPSGLKAALDARLGVGAPSAFFKDLLTAASKVALRVALEIKGAALKDEGAGNGLDADLLDGKHGDYYLEYGNLKNPPEAFPPGAHKHPWKDITDAPSTATRWPSFGEVTAKPNSYPPLAHTHAASETNSGTFHLDRIPALPISRVTSLQPVLDGKANLSGARYTGTTGNFVGKLGSQQIMHDYGWENGIARAKWVIEPNATVSLYGYNDKGGAPTKILNMGTPVNGGDYILTAFGRNIVATNGNSPGYIRLNGAGAAYYAVDRTTARDWAFYARDNRFIVWNGQTDAAWFLPDGGLQLLGNLGADGGYVRIGREAGRHVYMRYNGDIAYSWNNPGTYYTNWTSANFDPNSKVDRAEFQGGGANNWKKGPDGTIEQWGVVIAPRFGQVAGPTIVFPVAFPNACTNVSTTDINPGFEFWHDAFSQVVKDSLTKTGFRTVIQGFGGGGDNWHGMYWRATGY